MKEYIKLTPRQQIRLFIAETKTLTDNQRMLRNKLIQDMIYPPTSKGLPREIVLKELRKFYDYWTELNSSGKKQRWEQQPTFEVKKRFRTWINNVIERNFKN